jgi:glutathione S-transferase
MAITLFDLSGKAGRRFSPFGWRARMALAHKGLERDARVEPIRFSDKAKLAFSGQQLVPVLVDGDDVVSDSWAIACHLEAAYADRPSLFGGDAGRGMARLIAAWVDTQVHPRLAPLIVADVVDQIEPIDLDYFRSSRETRFGKRLEEIRAEREGRVDAFREVLAPARRVLGDQPYIGGAAPTFADYALFGAFMWARGVSPFRLLAGDDPVHGWRERLLDSFDGMPRREPGHPV